MNTIVFTFKVQRADTAVTTIIVPDDYPTIQEAVDAASPGDTIFIKSGLYVENITAGKSLTFMGEDRDEVIVTTNETLDPFIFDISSEKYTFSGITFLGHSFETAGIHGGYNTIVNCKFLFHFSGIYGGCDNVSNNVFVDNARGMTLGGTNPVVTNNEFMSNGAGIMIAYTENATIQENVFHKNYCGIAWFFFSLGENNTVSNNIFTFNDEGMDFDDADDVGVITYHNDFLNNTVQVENLIFSTECTWDDGYPSGGNYWSDYNGSDFLSGPYQNVTGSDELGDVPYVVIGWPEWPELNFTDNYPLMSPYQYIPGDVNRDRRVRIDDILTIALAFGSNLGDPAFRPLMDITGDGKIRIDDILAAATNFGLGG
ncbi:MAG: right-handed parallel beta-helix repeat-containing protein [Candidatus Bathyarchaeota archaeon]|nr:right-handed parallel beta-helix repeat-containing protein [Candidatus Bathyarchaeota archaeon]MDH5733360.1 right-handed parallel beta-helix repeat-containing protein [Candidatus Bathyarchaeota archaeon]